MINLTILVLDNAYKNTSIIRNKYALEEGGCVILFMITFIRQKTDRKI